MVSHKSYDINANEDFVMFLTSKLITWFIGGFTLKMKSQSIAYLLDESEHIYWILDLEGEVHSIWDLWINSLQKYKGNGFFEVGRAGSSFQSDPENLDFLDGRLPLPESDIPKSSWGELNVLPTLICISILESNSFCGIYSNNLWFI
jgi:hypothetical protein